MKLEDRIHRKIQKEGIQLKLSAAQAIREKYPDANLVFCADNDQFIEGNPGVKYAREAAKRVNGLVIIPQFKDVSSKPTDFNDLAKSEGIDAVCRQTKNIDKIDGDSENASILSTFWEDPINPFENIDLGLPGWNREYCPAIISDFAEDESERMGVIPSQIAGPAIAAISGLIPDERKLCMKLNDKGWMEAARLWIATVGSSGAKKTPAKLRVDRIIKKIGAERYAAFRDEYKLYEQDLKDFNSNEQPRSRAARYRRYAKSSNNFNCPRCIWL